MAITFTGTGDWTTAARWSGGAEPTATDDVIISGDCTISVNGVSGTDVRFKSLTTASGGILRVVPAANLVIAAYGEATFGTASSFLCDVSGSAYTTTIKLNAGGTAAAYTGMTFGRDMTRSNIVGASKMLWTRLDGAANSGLAGTTGFYVDDATGWLAGDTVIIGATGTYSATPNIDSRVIDAPIFDSGTTGRALIKWSSGGNLTYTHPDNMYVGNFTRNLKVVSGDTSAYNKYGRGLTYSISSTLGSDGMFTLSGVEFRYLSSYYSLGCIKIENSGSAGRPKAFTSIDNLSFYAMFGREFLLGDCSPALDFPMHDFLSYRPGGAGAVNNSQAEFLKTTVPNTFVQPIDRVCILNHTESANYGIFNAHYTTVRVTNSAFGHIGCFTPMSFPGGNYVFENCSWYGTSRTLNYAYDFGRNAAVNCKFNTEFGNSGTYVSDWRYLTEFVADNCSFWADPPHSQTYVQTYAMPSFNLTYTNFNNVATDHRKYQRAGTWLSTTTAVNGPLAWSGKVIDTNFTMLHEVEVIVPPNVTTLIKANTRRDDAAVGITISAVLAGVDLDSVSHSAAINTWQTHDLSFSHAESGPKIVTIRYEISSTVANKTGIIDGVFNFPFVPKTRWYGYVFDETNPIRTVQLATTEASESVAYGYTDFDITEGASQSDVALIANSTFRKLFDYSQAWGVQNFAYAVPVTADGPDTFRALGDVDCATYTLNGSGSLSIGSHTLSAEFSTGTGYTYTGGTFSQASTTPAFSGGVLTLPTKITGGGDFSMTGGTVEFGAAGADWNLSAASYSGTITLKTTAGQSVTVAMPTPSGFTIDNTEPGNITVTSPVVMATGTVSNLPIVGNLIRLQIYNMSTDTIIYSDDPGSATYSTSYVDGVGISGGDTLRIRFVELNGGTSFKFFSMLVDATSSGFSVDANNYIESNSVYALNGVDGSSSTVTDKFSADFSLTDPQINLKITSNFIAAEYYAFWCFLLTDEVGIGIFWGGITANDVGNYQTNVGVVDMYLDNITTASQRQTDSARIYRSDGAYPVLDPTTSGYGIDLNWQNVVYVVSISGSSVLSPTESAQLMSLSNNVNVARVNNLTVAGSGVPPTFDADGVMTDPGDPLRLV